MEAFGGELYQCAADAQHIKKLLRKVIVAKRPKTATHASSHYDEVVVGIHWW